MGERKQRWRNTKIITFLPNRPFPHSTAVSKQKNEVEARVDNFIQITVFCPPMPRLDAFVHRNLMQERSTHSCITAAKWDAHDVENKAGNARRCNPGRQIFINIFLTTPAKKLLSIFFYCDPWKASFIVHYQSDCIPKSVTASRKHCKQFIHVF